VCSSDLKIAIGKRFRAKRRTLQKQLERVIEVMNKIRKGETLQMSDNVMICRSCGEAKCDGGCWGVHGLKRKYVLEKNKVEKQAKNIRISSNKRQSKVHQKEKDIDEIKKFGLSRPCSEYRHTSASLRCPPPFVRELRSSVKGKWVGKSIQSVLQSEFHELGDAERLQLIFRKSLIRVNGIPVNSDAALFKGVDTNRALSEDVLLRNMDIVSRLTHWHEPPVQVPDTIEVQKIQIPEAILDEYFGSSSDAVGIEDTCFFCCNKPSTVPVHPTGPYIQNTLTLMVEAEQGLEPRSLLPCHRLDRCTSGLTLCCTSPSIARLLQVQMDRKLIDKMYLARVQVRKSKFCSFFHGL
jgi:23S rRNA-/tRNA-specific pseudouridylate synthase